MGLFASLPVRANGGTVYAGWWNDIRTLLISIFGAGSIGETQFSLANSQGAAADVTGLVFSAASYRGAEVEYDISRKTDTVGSEVRSIGILRLGYRVESSAWDILGGNVDGDSLSSLPAGVTLSVTAAGQVQYLTTNIAGANYIGTINFRARTFNA